MAASAWQLYNEAKKYIGNGTIKLGAGVTTKFYMQLHTSASNASTFTLSVSNSVSNQVATAAGYVAGGRLLVPETGQWVNTSAKQMKFTMSAIGIAFTASGATLENIKFAVLRNSVSSGVGKVLCWCKLSSSEFDLASPNTLTVLPAATGIFTIT
jgi:hypothetical protein